MSERRGDRKAWRAQRAERAVEKIGQGAACGGKLAEPGAGRRLL